MKYCDKIYNLFIAYAKENSALDIYDDYRDHENIEFLLYYDKTIKTACGNTIRKKEKIISCESFIDRICDAYMDAEGYYKDQYIKEFLHSIKSESLQRYIENHKSDIEYVLDDIFYDYVSIVYPIESFLDDTIKINIFWDQKNSSGFDNVFLPFLLNSQGYYLKDHKYFKKLVNNLHSYYAFHQLLSNKDKKQVEIDSKDAFLNSLIQEIDNCYLDSPKDLCFIATVTIRDYFKLLEKNRKFTISKDAVCGLVDRYNGGGSILNINLKKDIVVNTNDITVLVEKIDKYTVDDIYGLVSSEFKHCIQL